MKILKENAFSLLLIIFLIVPNFYLAGQVNCDFQIEVGPDLNLNLGESLELQSQVSIPASQINNIKWAPNVGLSCQECYNTIAMPSEDICYTFAVTDTSNCTIIDTVCIFVSIPNSIDGITRNASFNLYPNPTIDILRINLSPNDFEDFEIYNAAGEVLKIDILTKSPHQIIDVSELSNGIYFIKIKFENHFEVRKFIKI